MASVLDYSAGQSILHKANPLTKIALGICICVASFLADSHLTLVALICISVALSAIAGIFKKGLILVRNFLILGLVLFFFQTLLVRTGEPFFLWVTKDGLLHASLVALRLMSFALPLMILLTVTKLTDLANASVYWLHIPYKYAFTITTALRFVPIFSSEMQQIMEAQTARGVEFDTKNPFKKLQLMMPLITPLMISSVAHVDEAALAAEARGFYLRGKESAYKSYPFVGRDFLIFAVGLGLIGFGIFC